MERADDNSEIEMSLVYSIYILISNSMDQSIS
jgi:hypothetical protein